MRLTPIDYIILLLLKHFDAFNLTWLIFKMSDLTSHRQTFWSAYTCMWFIMFFGRSDFSWQLFVFQVDVTTVEAAMIALFEKKTAVFKGLYCDPKPILCHCKIGGETILHLRTHKFFSEGEPMSGNNYVGPYQTFCFSSSRFGVLFLSFRTGVLAVDS